MDDAERQILRELIREEVQSVREEVQALERRLSDNHRVMFRQFADLYRGTQEKIEHLEKHIGEQFSATRGAIESLRASIERQDFRADDLGRRVGRLEIRFEPPE